jgi:hypothetical protein
LPTSFAFSLFALFSELSPGLVHGRLEILKLLATNMHEVREDAMPGRQ